jgi:hypothetical protein
VGAGSSAQFLTAAIGADAFAVSLANGTTSCAYHWTGSSAGELFDPRASEFEPGNVWIVWLGDCTNGNTPTDIWTDISVDSTVGNRAFFAQLSNNTSGDTLYVIPSAGSSLIQPNSLWPDGNADTSIITDSNIGMALGTDATGNGDVHVNLGLTDIRPEDALFATTRSLNKFTATLTGLGYGPGSIGTPIQTGIFTGTRATPIKFALTGNDPLTNEPVRAYVTTSLGAAPVIFVYNNNGVSANKVTNLVTGVGATGTLRFKTAYLFDGTSSCDTHNAAFGGNGDGLGQPIHVYIREPLSGTMNTTEYNVFRTTGNTSDSQEKGVSLSTGNHNPLSYLACGASNTLAGDRTRVIGTGEARDAINTSKKNGNGQLFPPYGLSYQFFGFANMAKYSGSTNYNYMLVDGVDPFGGTALANTAQTPPNCAGPCETGSGQTWGGQSFVTLRNGTYKVWSIYRWVTQFDAASETDTLGPAHLAQKTQDNVDTTVADFVPYCTSDSSDSLSIYREHYLQSSIPADDGSLSACGNDVGGGTLGSETGGDVGGLITGPFDWTFTQNDIISTTGTTNNVTWHSGPQFTKGASWVGGTVLIDSIPYTIVTPNPSATLMHVSPIPPKYLFTKGGATLSTVTTAAPTVPGPTGKKQ